MRANRTLSRLRADQTVFGCAMQFYRSTEIPRAFAAAGFDFVFLDMEHSGFGLETAQDMIAAAAQAGITPLVRTCELAYSQVARYLDVGAQGIIFPRVDDPRLLCEAVSWTKYPPQGKRGFGFLPPLLDYQQLSMEEITAELNQSTMVVVQFETRRALEMADELLSVPGVDVAMVGPSDLSISLGVAGQMEHPELVGAVERLMERCAARGVAPGIHCRDAAGALFWAGRGMRFVGAGGEHAMLLEKARETLARLVKTRQAVA